MSEHSITIAPRSHVLTATAQIAASFLARNETDAEQIPSLITRIHGTLLSLTASTETPAPAAYFTGAEDEAEGHDHTASAEDQPAEHFQQKPVVDPKKSVFPDYIICLEDGKRLKMLRRHLRTSFNMTPEQYREKWGLPHNYPITAPNYAKVRSGLAKSHGLGLSGKPRKSRAGK